MIKRNILLINPWIYDFAAYDLWMKPLGLLYVAAFLEKFGYSVSFINCMERNHPALKRNREKKEKYDCGKFFAEEVEKPSSLKDVPRRYKRYGIPLPIFEEELSKIPPPKLIGVTSGMTYWYPGVFEVIRRIKSFFPKALVVLGGIYATLCSKHAKKFSRADYIIEGRGEWKILRIADEIFRIKRDYSSLLKKREKLLYPAYHLLRRVDSISLLTSFGCPFQCTYCASRILQPSFYQRDPEEVIREIDYFVRNFRIKDIAFYDDALLVNPQKHILPILKKIIEKNEGIRFHTPNGLHIRYISKIVAKRLYQANFKTIRLSLETSNFRRQKNSGHKVSNKEFVQAINNLKEAGYSSREIEVYVMMGLPGQSLKEVMDSAKFVHSLKVKIKLVQFSPIPGTKEYEKAVKEYGFNKDEPLFQNNSVFPLKKKGISFQEFWEIKNFVNELNLKLS